jgi:lambda family phage portal protein
MIGEAFDHLVSWINPAKAARRSYARSVYRRRSYDGAKSDRTNDHWRPSNRSPDMELMSDANTIRARARDLTRNNAYARGIINALLRNVVGCGIVPQARVVTDAGEPIEVINDACDTLFDRWARVADAGNRLTFWEIQRLAYREVIEAGECLIHFTTIEDDRARPVSLALELIDADRLAEDYLALRRASPEAGNEIRRGVEVDSLGRPVAYWLYPGHPADLYSGFVTPIRRPASEFLHLYRMERIGQTRGISLFAPLISWLKNLGYYVDNELQASAVASCFTAAITTMGGPADGGLLAGDETSSSDSDANQFEYLQPGMVARLMPGEKVETVDPTRPNTSAEAWINLMLRSMAVGSGLSYERMAKDYSKTNYSSARASDLEDRREFRADQEWLEYHLVGPVWQRFIETAVLEGKLSIPAEQLVSDYDRYTAHAYQAPGWEWVDPVKEAESSQMALDSNLTTLADELGQRGRDLMDTLRQRQREKKLLDKFGLTPEPVAPSQQKQQADPTETETEMDTENGKAQTAKVTS